MTLKENSTACFIVNPSKKHAAQTEAIISQVRKAKHKQSNLQRAQRMQTGIQSLAVVSGSHMRADVHLLVRDCANKKKKNGGGNEDFVKVNGSSMLENELANQAQLIDHRPQCPESSPNATTIVLWLSNVVHCNAVYTPQRKKRTASIQKKKKVGNSLRQGYVHPMQRKPEHVASAVQTSTQPTTVPPSVEQLPTTKITGNPKRKRKVAFQPLLTTEGHFRQCNVDKWRAHLIMHGWVVVEMDEETDSTRNATQLLREGIASINKEPLPHAPTDNPLHGITEAHLPPLKAKGLRMYYGLAQTRYADALRLYARQVFAQLYDVDESNPKALTCSLDSGAIGIDTKCIRSDNWLHVDKHPDNPEFCVQGTVCIHTPDALPWTRVGQHVCWMPTAQRLPDARERFHKIRYSGASSTHWATRGVTNAMAVPTFRPPPNPNLVPFVPDEATDRLFDVLVPKSNEQ